MVAVRREVVNGYIAIGGWRAIIANAFVAEARNRNGKPARRAIEGEI